MNRHRILCAIVCLVGLSVLSPAGQRQPDPELKPREITFSANPLTWKEILEQLQKQTGNIVKDGRKNPGIPTITLTKRTGTFWEMLDALGKDTGVGFSLYQEDGGVALVDTPYRELKTHHSGLCRFACKRIAVSRDEETQTHLCNVTLEAAWEPRLNLLFLNLESAEVGYQAKTNVAEVRQKLVRQSSQRVTGLRATDLELRMNAPARTTQQIAALSGVIRVVGIPKMLEFQFAKPATGKKDEKEGVKVHLRAVKREAKQWFLDLEHDYPKGTLDELQSFEKDAWTYYNRVWLSWRDARTKKIVEMEPSGEASSRDGPGTLYTFRPPPPKDAEVTLHFLTGNRVAVFTVPFAFRDLPLP